MKINKDDESSSLMGIKENNGAIDKAFFYKILLSLLLITIF